MKVVSSSWSAVCTSFYSVALCAMLFALCGSVDAQQAGKIFRIGYLDPSTASGMAVLLDAFRQELSKLGWIEGKNITIEYRFAEQKPERLPELAADVVRLKVDLIVTSGGPTPLAAKKATSSHFSRRDYIEGCKRREYFHLNDPGGSALLSRRQTVNWTPMAAIRLCTSQCPIRRRCYSLVADSADNPQISAA